MTPIPNKFMEEGRECIERALIETARTSTSMYPIPATLQEEIAKALKAFEERGRKAARHEAIDEVLNLMGCTAADIRFSAGEMTAQEMRSVKAVLSWKAKVILSLKERSLSKTEVGN